jgi:hypothetical protein
MKRRSWFYIVPWLLGGPAVAQTLAGTPKDRMPPWFRNYLTHLPRRQKRALARYFFGGVDMDDLYAILGGGNEDPNR